MATSHHLPKKRGALKHPNLFFESTRPLVLLRAPLFLGKWFGVATYFLYKKKIRKNK